MATDKTLARGLGILSLGLGLSQLLAPRWYARTIGVQRGNHDAVIRLVGIREVVAAIGLLSSRNAAPWVWLRLGGDVMDLALLGRAATSKDVRSDRLSGALAGTVAVTAADLLSGVAVATARDGNGNGHDRQQRGSTPVRRSVTIARPAAELYGYWRQLENLPRFMRHLEDVRQLDDRRSHWVATAPFGTTVEWDAEITDDVPEDRISWRSVDGSSVRHAGTVRFKDAPGDRGTEVHVELTYEPPAGPIGVALAKLTGEEPSQQISEDLRRFKQLMETGAIPRSEATNGERRLRQRPAQPVPVGVAVS